MLTKSTMGVVAMVVLCHLMLGVSHAQSRKDRQKPKAEKWAELAVTVHGADMPVENAQVYIASLRGNHSDTLKTDQSGKVVFERVPLGEVQVNVIATGWKTFETKEALNEGSNNLSVALTPMERPGEH